MPSPFPGMDPFIEAQKWTSFHTRFITELSDVLVAKLGPRYEADPEERIYVETVFDELVTYRADVALRQGTGGGDAIGVAGSRAVETTTYTLPLPSPQEQREPFVVIRHAKGGEIVAIVELLSPTNKRKGSDGWREYLKKRADVLRSPVHLVEIDLLLGGTRLPTQPQLKPATDYCAMVSRATERPRAEVYEWSIRQAIPAIHIPLAGGDPDVHIDLQQSFTTVFDRGGYRHSLRYREPLELPVREMDLTWLQAQIAAE